MPYVGGQHVKRKHDLTDKQRQDLLDGWAKKKLESDYFTCHGCSTRASRNLKSQEKTDGGGPLCISCGMIKGAW